MAKISRPVVYTFVGAVAVYAVVLLTQPDAPAPHRRPRHPRAATADAEPSRDADLAAHFARYHAGKRNPFLSGCPRAKPEAGPARPGDAASGR